MFSMKFKLWVKLEEMIKGLVRKWPFEIETVLKKIFKMCPTFG